MKKCHAVEDLELCTVTVKKSYEFVAPEISRWAHIISYESYTADFSRRHLISSILYHITDAVQHLYIMYQSFYVNSTTENVIDTVSGAAPRDSGFSIQMTSSDIELEFSIGQRRIEPSILYPRTKRLMTPIKIFSKVKK